MLNLIPQPKKIVLTEGYLPVKAIRCFDIACPDQRVAAAAGKLPCDDSGVILSINAAEGEAESYCLNISCDRIAVTAAGPAGAFYAIQTLRQLFALEKVPCLQLEDQPDFSYRGFYHDVTRGKIPTMQTLKELVDRMAYYKLNSFQLYVEHTFEFEECKDINPTRGYMTKEEMKELGDYCRQNFIDFNG